MHKHRKTLIHSPKLTNCRFDAENRNTSSPFSVSPSISKTSTLPPNTELWLTSSPLLIHSVILAVNFTCVPDNSASLSSIKEGMGWVTLFLSFLRSSNRSLSSLKFDFLSLIMCRRRFLVEVLFTAFNSYLRSNVFICLTSLGRYLLQRIEKCLIAVTNSNFLIRKISHMCRLCIR